MVHVTGSKPHDALPAGQLGVENRQRQHGDEDHEHRSEQKIDRFGGKAGRGAGLRVWHSISLQK
jgi:hypothetical protein